jgi:hypothetical protein
MEDMRLRARLSPRNPLKGRMTSMGFLSSETKEEKLERLDREAEQRQSGPR